MNSTASLGSRSVHSRDPVVVPTHDSQHGQPDHLRPDTVSSVIDRAKEAVKSVPSAS